jgi:hypothetical protein
MLYICFCLKINILEGKHAGSVDRAYQMNNKDCFHGRFLFCFSKTYDTKADAQIYVYLK